MRIRTVLVSALAAVFAATLTVVLPTPVGAQTEPCPPGQPPGRPPGIPNSPPGQPDSRPPGTPSQYPPGKCELLLSRSVVVAGKPVGVAGSGFAPGAQVQVRAAGVTLGTALAGSGGSFSTEVVVPKSTAPGTYDVSAAGAAAGGGTQVLSASLTVTGAGGPSSDTAGLGGSLPRTGSGDGLVPLSVLASVLLAIGTAALVGARRRRGTRPA